MDDDEQRWVELELPDLEVGRVTTVVAGGRALCITRTPDGWGVLDNRCPHQGGPLGDGQLENGYVICPWHAYEYDPSTGRPPAGFNDGAAAYARDCGAAGFTVKKAEDLKRALAAALATIDRPSLVHIHSSNRDV